MFYLHSLLAFSTDLLLVSRRGEGSSQPKCPACDYSAKTQRDVTRHYTSVHARIPSCFCDEPDCPRFTNGWARKDLRDSHVKRKHHRLAQDDADGLPTATSSSAIDPVLRKSPTSEGWTSHVLGEGPANYDSLKKLLAKEHKRRLEAEGKLKMLRKVCVKLLL